MKNLLTTLLAISLVSSLASSQVGAEPAKDLKQSEEYKIGVMVKAIAAAIKAPEKPESLKTIATHGTDSRYYVMIRGWLTQELRGVESQFRATRDEARKEKFQHKVDFLKKAIRRIDLE